MTNKEKKEKVIDALNYIEEQATFSTEDFDIREEIGKNYDLVFDYITKEV